MRALLLFILAFPLTAFCEPPPIGPGLSIFCDDVVASVVAYKEKYNKETGTITVLTEEGKINQPKAQWLENQDNTVIISKAIQLTISWLGDSGKGTVKYADDGKEFTLMLPCYRDNY